MVGISYHKLLNCFDRVFECRNLVTELSELFGSVESAANFSSFMVDMIQESSW